jgi:hypothetical protein
VDDSDIQKQLLELHRLGKIITCPVFRREIGFVLKSTVGVARFVTEALAPVLCAALF